MHDLIYKKKVHYHNTTPPSIRHVNYGGFGMHFATAKSYKNQK